MSEPTISFKYLNHTKRDDGSIERYALEVVDIRNGKIEQISVEPGHLASAQSMKRILLGRCMLYSVTQKKHAQMLLEVFRS